MCERILLLLCLLLPACSTDRPPAARAAAKNDQAVAKLVSGPFSSPESVLHDSSADVYLVSNIHGGGMDRDDNGYITRLRPDGSVEQERWIDGASGGVRLDAPKGMALRGDTLFVADIDSVRAFHRVTGMALGARGIPGAFLNDIAAGDDGLYVTDTGLGGGVGAVYALRDSVVLLARGDALHGPNGLVFTKEGLLFVSWSAPEVWRLPASGGEPALLARLPAGKLDGLVRLSDGTLLVSSWQLPGIFRVRPGQPAERLEGEWKTPADLGVDERRRLLLIPLLQSNEVAIRRLR